MSSGCVGSEKTSASVSGATLNPGRPAKFKFGKKFSPRESSSASESGSPGSGRFPWIKKSLAGTHLRGAVPFMPPVQSPSRVQLNRGPEPFRSDCLDCQDCNHNLRFGGPVPRPQETEISLDQEIEKREMNLRAEQEKIEELRLKKAATVAQLRYDRMDWRAESGSEMEEEQFAAVTAMRREAQMMMKMRLKMQVEQQMLEEEKMKLEKDKEILKLKEKVKLLQEVQVRKIFSSNVKDRLGPKNNPEVASISLNKKQVNWGRNNNKNQMEVRGRSRQQNGIKRKFGQMKNFGNKNNNYGQSRLPDDLVMTNITEEGPRKARPRIVFDSDLPADLILTEFTEDGPKPRVFKSETKVKSLFKFQDADDVVLNNVFVGEDDDKVVTGENDEEEQESDLNRYEGADNLF